MTNLITGLILIIDDTPANLDVISETLSDAGFDIAIATSGERALQQIERRLPDLILLDVMMPGINGFETCQRLKANQKTHDIPVIFMTSFSDTPSKILALELGAIDYITKPFHEMEVLARVKTHLQLCRLTQTLESQVAQKAAQLQASQLQLIQSEKMSALGQLVAGVAHEINNPVGFVRGNLNHLKQYIQDLLQLINLYHHHYPQPVAEIQLEIDKMELDYIQEDLPKLMQSMETGIHRIEDISTSLRTFSRSDSNQSIPFNIHEGIDITLLMLKYRLKANDFRPAIEVIKEYSDLPLVECYAGLLNQVFMNLIANAIDAVEDSNTGRSFEQIQAHPNQITIRTTTTEDGQKVVIQIQDNGVGMCDEVKQKIFDYLFTTKGVGKGTGLGMAIARQIVVEKHGGTLDVYSELGCGSTFVITIPINA